MINRPLEGLTVIDMGQVLATPFGTYLLHLLGADVIKIEPPYGEMMRSGGRNGFARRDGDGDDESVRQARSDRSFATQNAGKQSICVDMRSSEGAEVVLRLAEKADVFVEGFAPGTADDMGVGWDAVSERNPGIVYGSLSAFGSDGPLGGRPGFDHVVQAMSGIMLSTGMPGDPPMKVGSPYLDYGGGLLLGFGVMAGLLEQRRTGAGVRVDVTMLDFGLLMNAGALVTAQATGGDPARAGNDTNSGAVASGTFKTADGWLSLAANKSRHVAHLESALGIEGLEEMDREAAQTALNSVFATQSATHWESLLSEAGVPVARVRALSEVVTSGYPIDRGLLNPVSIPGSDDPLYLPGVGVRLNGNMPAPTVPPPSLGQHTAEVLGRFGFSDEEIDELTESGVVGTH